MIKTKPKKNKTKGLYMSTDHQKALKSTPLQRVTFAVLSFIKAKNPEVVFDTDVGREMRISSKVCLEILKKSVSKNGDTVTEFTAPSTEEQVEETLDATAIKICELIKETQGVEDVVLEKDPNIIGMYLLTIGYLDRQKDLSECTMIIGYSPECTNVVLKEK